MKMGEGIQLTKLQGTVQAGEALSSSGPNLELPILYLANCDLASVQPTGLETTGMLPTGPCPPGWH